jgi:hypothetical protein
MLLTIACAFTQGVVMRTDFWSAVGAPAALIMSIRVDAFLPFATWLLATCFPERRTRATVLDRIAAIGTYAMAAVGIVLLAAHLSTQRIVIDGDLAAYDAVATGYWTTVFAGTLAALALMVLKARASSQVERARLRLLLTHLITVGGVLAAYVVLTELSPALRNVLAQGGLHRLLMPLLQLLVLSLPFVATYALLVESAVDETVKVRNQVGYHVASTLLAIGAAVPFVLVAWYLWNLRGQTIGDAFSGMNLVALIAAVSLGVLLFRMRASASAAVDREFVRASYDVNGLLANLHDRIATAQSPDELAAHVSDALGTLGYEKTELILSPESQDATHDDEPRSAFPWRVPIKGDNGATFAMLELGAKRRDAPITEQDRDFVAALARQLPRPLALLLGPNDIDERPARECVDCRAIFDASVLTCPTCSSIETEPSHLPKRLRQRFTVLRRLGTGSMGVVYEASDDMLNRRVALKTLPRVGAHRIAQLREEAQTMARVSHPNIATVYQLELWRGVPVIVMELFDRGTFAGEHDPIVGVDALKVLGSSLVEGLACLHAAGLVHADLKPSNVGVAASGFPKIMDFGLARLLGPGMSTLSRETPLEALYDEEQRSYLSGTPAYLAPELVRGAAPTPGSDLWALAVSLFEIYTGVHPFRRSTVGETMRAIIRDPIPDLDTLRSDSTVSIGDFFAGCLARHPDERPATADEFRSRLAAV